MKNTVPADEITLRRWLRSDIDAIVRYVNNRNVWITLNDCIPHPYTVVDAESWIAFCDQQGEPVHNFAIDLKSEAIGAIGLRRLVDVYRLTAAIGYWIGEPLWGRGIATAALERATAYGFATLGLERIQASVYEGNLASARVLEKVGYTFEGRLRRNVFKDGQLRDSYMYSRIR
ncbi:MAG TPA: GNAT family protein [Candidatus Binataceae bacterium]|nr:GNAT family protein [Candidatus Binataceae bacterium]